MPSLLIPNKIKIVIGILAIFIFILATSIFITSTTQELTPDPAPTPPSIPFPKIPAEEPGYNGPLPGSVYQTSTPESERLARINELNGLLLKKLPYSGNNFRLVYDYDSNGFIATLRSGIESQGREELLVFLKSNDIESTDWLINFKEEVQ